jgi:hypothetical protein
MGVVFFSSEIYLNFLCLNIYDTYNVDRRQFWEHTLQNPLLKFGHTFIGGELNLTLGYSEIWGSATHMDPSTVFLNKSLEEASFLDIQPTTSLLGET